MLHVDTESQGRGRSTGTSVTSGSDTESLKSAGHCESELAGKEHNSTGEVDTDGMCYSAPPISERWQFIYNVEVWHERGKQV